MAALLSLAGVGFARGSCPVLSGIDLALKEGEVLGVLGPNGSGKSTLLGLMDGLLAPSQGALRIQGDPIAGMSRRELARRVAVVAQETQFQVDLTALEVVLQGRFPHLDRWGFESERDLAIARDALVMTKASDFAGRSIHKLSGGERQRVLIARALAQEPRLLLLDEPTSFLDLRYKLDTFALIRRLADERGLGVVLVSHDLDMIARHCDRVMILRRGECLALGEPAAVMTSARLSQAFDCPVEVIEHPITGQPIVTSA